jgi:hypothetical protein
MGCLALVLGPVAFFRARKYFPERAEAITPEQLRIALEKLAYDIRESTNVTVGRAQTAFELQHNQIRTDMGELKTSMIEAHRKAGAASDEAVAARHKSELIEHDVQALEKLMNEKLDHITTLLKQGKQ